jgi:predicted Zn-dependent protease
MIHALLLLVFSITCFAQDANELEATLKKKPDNMRVRIELANVYANEGRADRVIELLNPYTDQLTSTGFILLASSYNSKGDYANEVRVLTLISNRDEENFQWHMLLAQAFVKQTSLKNTDEKTRELVTNAVQRYRRVLQLKPKYQLAFNELLKLFLDQRMNNEARELMMEGISKFGRRPELFRELCRLDSQDGYLVQAVANCTDSIKLSPEFPDHYVYLVQALYDQKEDKRAEAQAVRAAKKFPKSEFVQWAAGTMFLRKKNFPVAARYFDAAVAAKPESTRAHYGLAQAQFESGQEGAALEHYIKACKGDASTVEAFFAATGKLKLRGDKLAPKYLSAANSCRP